jgi:hypothetical protein
LAVVTNPLSQVGDPEEFFVALMSRAPTPDAVDKPRYSAIRTSGAATHPCVDENATTIEFAPPFMFEANHTLC